MWFVIPRQDVVARSRKVEVQVPCGVGGVFRLGTMKPADPEAEAWVSYMQERYGPDHTQWPTIGCGSKFYAHKYGPSRVV